MKEREQEKLVQKRPKPKKQEQTIYVPPSKRENGADANMTFLFTFEFEDEAGSSHIVDVHEVVPFSTLYNSRIVIL